MSASHQVPASTVGVASAIHPTITSSTLSPPPMPACDAKAPEPLRRPDLRLVK